MKKIKERLEFKRFKKLKFSTFEKYKVIFTTRDNKKHEFNNFTWVRASGLSCTSEEWLMFVYYDKKNCMCDNNNNYYPFENIIKIEWVLLETKILKNHFGDDIFQPINYEDDDIVEMEKINSYYNNLYKIEERN